jgi:hypothetical protein
VTHLLDAVRDAVRDDDAVREMDREGDAEREVVREADRDGETVRLWTKGRRVSGCVDFTTNTLQG